MKILQSTIGLVVIISVTYFFFIFDTDKKDVASVAQPKVDIKVDVKTKGESEFARAPDFRGLENWINGDSITSLEDLRGRVVLIDFWTYSCINCIRTLPHLQTLYEKYQDEDFVIIGIHAPEFAYEKKIENVKAAVKKYGLTYPIVQDNNFETWRAFENRYWPAHYVIDKEGFIRHTHFGEGGHAETDAIVARLLQE